MPDEINKTKKAIESKFQALVERAETDPQLKKEIFSTIRRIENIALLTDLFTIKLIKTETSFFNKINKDSEGEKEDEK